MTPKLAVCTAVFAAFTGLTAQADVIVSSKIDTEGGVLGHVILAVLTEIGVPAQDRIQLGGTPVMRQALIAGEIDIYPEYTGNAAYFFERAEEPIWHDAQQAYDTAKALDYAAHKIVWLPRAPANNTWGIGLRKEVAQANDITSFSDFARYIRAGGAVKLAAAAEFVNSAPALPAFQTAYDFALSDAQLIVLSGGDTAATIQAADRQTSGANAAMIYGTDGVMAFSNLIALEDDKHVQPIYEPSPIIREEVLTQYPQIEAALAPVFAALDLATLQRLNGQVQVEGMTPKDVAEQWLTEKGFVH